MHGFILRLFTVPAAVYIKMKKLEMFQVAFVVYIKVWKATTKIYKRKNCTVRMEASRWLKCQVYVSITLALVAQ